MANERYLEIKLGGKRAKMEGGTKARRKAGIGGGRGEDVNGSDLGNCWTLRRGVYIEK